MRTHMHMEIGQLIHYKSLLLLSLLRCRELSLEPTVYTNMMSLLLQLLLMHCELKGNTSIDLHGIQQRCVVRVKTSP